MDEPIVIVPKDTQILDSQGFYLVTTAMDIHHHDPVCLEQFKDWAIESPKEGDTVHPDILKFIQEAIIKKTYH